MTIRVSKAFELVEIYANQIQVTKNFIMLELGSGEIDVTKAFVLFEISNAEINVTKAFALVELGLNFPTRVPTLGGFECTYDGNDITPYVVSASLTVETPKIDTNAFTDEHLTFLNGVNDWHAELAGLWAPELDAIFGETIAQETPTKTTFVFKIGPGIFSVTYAWTDEAFVSRYATETNLDGALTYTAKIALSGAPTRSART